MNGILKVNLRQKAIMTLNTPVLIPLLRKQSGGLITTTEMADVILMDGKKILKTIWKEIKLWNST